MLDFQNLNEILTIVQNKKKTKTKQENKERKTVVG